MGAPVAFPSSALVPCWPDPLPGAAGCPQPYPGAIATFPLPLLFLQARLDILKIHSRKMNLTRGINLRKIAELMPGASGAEVKVSWGHRGGTGAGSRRSSG